ncbi:MAG: DUF4345 domain-containing protein [Rhodanobacteraceae bacterium]|nr:DUF4345 domain-containing protein [Rhodanobacteraceae bacterium]
MVIAYLLINAVLYAAFALASSLVPERIAAALGFTLDAQGRVEFLTVYGGLELGLAAFYAWTVYAGPEPQRTGLVFSLFLYAGLVIYRLAGILRYGVPGTTMLAVAGLELFLLLAALALCLRAN